MPVRIGWIDSARGLAILLVLAYHASQWSASAGYPSEVWLYVNGLLATMRMPVFFAMSGMLAVKWMTRPWHDLLTSKVAVLLWLYVVWQAITAVVYMVVPNVSTPGKTNAAELVTALATPLRPQGALWFIWALALLLIVCRALWRLPGWLIIVLSAAISTLSFGDVISLGNVGWDGALDNFVFFAFGAFYAGFLRSAAERLNPLAAGSVVLVWVAFVVLVPFRGMPGVNLISRALGLAAGVCIGYALARVTALRTIGSNTLYLYLPHFTTLTVLAYGLSILSLPPQSELWTPVALFLACIAISATLWAVSRRSPFVRAAFVAPDRVLRLISHRRLSVSTTTSGGSV